MPHLMAGPHHGTLLVGRPDSRRGVHTRRLRPPRNASCGDCGGSGANSSGKTCGTCNGLGDIHCLAGRQGAHVLPRSMIRKEGP
ncbi:hypothetical protein [Streptomyces sp. NPDC001930]|uniref:hypothetical protein n=1 Tax=Streptomyces sp. NPDC001930 TaxID=3364625 RepID=UPI0036D1E1E2